MVRVPVMIAEGTDGTDGRPSVIIDPKAMLYGQLYQYELQGRHYAVRLNSDDTLDIFGEADDDPR